MKLIKWIHTQQFKEHVTTQYLSGRTMKYFAICLLLFMVNCIVGGSGGKKPNIVMIVADDLVSFCLQTTSNFNEN